MRLKSFETRILRVKKFDPFIIKFGKMKQRRNVTTKGSEPPSALQRNGQHRAVLIRNERPKPATDRDFNRRSAAFALPTFVCSAAFLLTVWRQSGPFCRSLQVRGIPFILQSVSSSTPQWLR